MFFHLLSICICASVLSIVRSGEICCASGCYNNDDPPYDGLPLPTCPEDMGISYLLYTPQNGDVPQTFSPGSVTSENLVMDSTARTVVVSHGWIGSEDNWWIIDMRELIIEKFGYNVIVADWEEGAGYYFYPKAAANTRTAGVDIANMIDLLVDLGYVHYDNLCPIGFSLGAHALGQAGSRTKGRIERITGLDPAGPWFADEPIAIGLNPSSATFVDVIHTDGDGFIAYYGQIRPLGHSDFYPNRGYRQPGCLTKKRSVDGHPWSDLEGIPMSRSVACSHYRALYLFLDTLRDPGCHVSTQHCLDEHDLPDSCTEVSSPVFVGVHADTNTAVGKFYFETESSEPFCMKPV